MRPVQRQSPQRPLTRAASAYSRRANRCPPTRTAGVTAAECALQVSLSRQRAPPIFAGFCQLEAAGTSLLPRGLPKRGSASDVCCGHGAACFPNPAIRRGQNTFGNPACRHSSPFCGRASSSRVEPRILSLLLPPLVFPSRPRLVLVTLVLAMAGLRSSLPPSESGGAHVTLSL
ncbi:hypothetical protein MRX96_019367 [Rhipicephalus microplus]